MTKFGNMTDSEQLELQESVHDTFDEDCRYLDFPTGSDIDEPMPEASAEVGEIVAPAGQDLAVSSTPAEVPTPVTPDVTTQASSDAKTAVAGKVLRLKGGADDSMDSEHEDADDSAPNPAVVKAQKTASDAVTQMELLKAQLAESQANNALAGAKIVASEAHATRLQVEMAALTESADDIRAKVSKPASAYVKPAEPRRPTPFSGEGKQGQAGAVRRFTNGLDVYFKLANVDPVHRVTHARLCLEGSAADYMHTAYQSLSDADSCLVEQVL